MHNFVKRAKEQSNYAMFDETFSMRGEYPSNVSGIARKSAENRTELQNRHVDAIEAYGEILRLLFNIESKNRLICLKHLVPMGWFYQQLISGNQEIIEGYKR